MTPVTADTSKADAPTPQNGSAPPPLGPSPEMIAGVEKSLDQDARITALEKRVGNLAQALSGLLAQQAQPQIQQMILNNLLNGDALPG